MHRSDITPPAALSESGQPLNANQQALWYFQELFPASSSYNVAGALNLHFNVDPQLLARSVEHVVGASPMLTSRFRFDGAEVRRLRAHDTETPCSLEVHDLGRADDEQLRARAQSLIERSFRLDREAPVRVGLLRRADAPDALVLVAHHIVVDLASLFIILRDLLTGYAALRDGLALPPVRTSADSDELARRQVTFLGSPAGQAASRHWSAQLADVREEDRLASELPRPPRYSPQGADVEFDLPEESALAVRAAAHRWRSAPFVVFLSTFAALIYAATRSPGFVLGYPVDLRPRGRPETIGHFINTLPLEIRIDPAGSFADLLARTQAQVLADRPHREYPMPLMSRLVPRPGAPGRAALIDALFVLNAVNADSGLGEVIIPDRLVHSPAGTVSGLPHRQQTGQFDLTMELMRAGSGYLGRLKYNSTLFTPATAVGLADAYPRLLTAAVNDALPNTLGEIRFPGSPVHSPPNREGHEDG